MNKSLNSERLGVLLDCSRNAVMRPEKIKYFIDCIQKMGYNMLELYTEDTLEIEGEPYFGYMRGRYTVEEIRDLDEYASARGVELVPCVQTLAHFTNIVRHSAYEDIVDFGDILLIDEQKTYDLIESIFKTLQKAYTSRIVNIGMDEAHMVGLGKYLDKHGYHERFSLLLKHLERVVEIAKKYGFTPHMWSDMFFRLASKEKYEAENSVFRYPDGVPELAGKGYYVDTPLEFKKELLDKIPQGVQLVYWDYYNFDEKIYDAMFSSHKGFCRELWFAGGAWNWSGFAPHNGYSVAAMKVAIKNSVKHGVKNTLITTWGDDGGECSAFSVLPSLFAISRYKAGVFDEAVIEKEFFQTFGISFADMMKLDIPNDCGKEIYGKNGYPYLQNPAKSLLYNDPFLGRMDYAVKINRPIPYGKYKAELSDAKKRAGEFGYLFNTLEKLCAVLEIKAELGVKTREVYKAADRKELERLARAFDECEKRLDEFIDAYYEQWVKENKLFGWEVQDIRLGGLKRRLALCKSRLKAYIDGKINKIEELEEELLPENESGNFYCNRYLLIASHSALGD